MHLTGTTTPQGLALANSLLANGGTLTIVRVVAGSGETAENAADLAEICQTLSVHPLIQKDGAPAWPVSLMALQAENAYTLRELGLYAQGHDDTEVLYQVYRMKEPLAIDPDSPMLLKFYFTQALMGVSDAHFQPTLKGCVLEEEFLPVREMLLLSAPPVKEVTLTVAEVQPYLDSLPRLVTEHITIYVADSGAADLTLEDFYGPGSILLHDLPYSGASITGSIRILNCSVTVSIEYLPIQAAAANAVLLYVNKSPRVDLSYVTLSNPSRYSNVTGIQADKNTHVCAKEPSASNLNRVFYACYNGCISVYAESAPSFSGNSIGARVEYSGTVVFGRISPSSVASTGISHYGGIVIYTNNSAAFQ